MAKLTKVQKQQLAELREYGPLYVGYNSQVIMRTFDKLVEKKRAEVVNIRADGKDFAAI